jgi:hypothetical protein
VIAPKVMTLVNRGLGRHGRAVVAEAQIQARAARADLQLTRLARRPGRILVGPWLSEVGFEILYWIPLLNWAAQRYGLERERMVALTRGGAGAWYADLCATAIDAFEFHSTEEVRSFNERRSRETGSLKQLTIRDLERDLISQARARLGGERLTVLHPSLLYNLLGAFWAHRRPIMFVERRSDFRRLPTRGLGESTPVDMAELPRDYVAVKAYFSSCFPDTPDNRRFLAGLVRGLARESHVVLLSTGIRVDDHSDFEAELRSDRVHPTHHLMSSLDNLAVQTRLIADARALFATYGGFSYLGPFYGVTSYSFYSHGNYNPAHLDVMARAVSRLRTGGGQAGFVTLSVQDAQLLESVISQRSWGQGSGGADPPSAEEAAAR